MHEGRVVTAALVIVPGRVGFLTVAGPRRLMTRFSAERPSCTACSAPASGLRCSRHTMPLAAQETEPLSWQRARQVMRFSGQTRAGAASADGLAVLLGMLGGSAARLTPPASGSRWRAVMDRWRCFRADLRAVGRAPGARARVSGLIRGLAGRDRALRSGGCPELGGHVPWDASAVFDPIAVCFGPVAYLGGAVSVRGGLAPGPGWPPDGIGDLPSRLRVAGQGVPQMGGVDRVQVNLVVGAVQAEMDCTVSFTAVKVVDEDGLYLLGHFLSIRVSSVI